MSAFMNSISSVFVILLMTASGYFFGMKKWILAEHKHFLEKYIMNFAIPCMCVDSLVRNLSQEILRGSLRIVAVSAMGLCLTTLLSTLVAYLLRLPRNRAGAFIVMGGFSNAIFVGYPMCRELFGEEAVVYVMLFFLSNSLLIYIGCNAAFAWFSETGSKLSLGNVLKKIFINPPVISAFIGILLVVTGITLPRTVNSFIGYIGATVSPLALLYCGFIIFEAGIKNIRFDRGIAVMPVMRFVLAPLVCAALCRIFNISAPASSVITVEMAMPVITIIVVMAKQWDADAEYAAIGVVLSTLACFIVVPILMMFF